MTGQLQNLALAILFFALGWIGHAIRERRNAPRKRRRAIPQGTDAEKRPRKPRKAKREPEQPPALPMGD